MAKSPSKTNALSRATTAQRNLNNSEERATQAARVRDQAVVAAQGAGATYAEILDATGLSTTRVTQILRRHRESVA